MKSLQADKVDTILDYLWSQKTGDIIYIPTLTRKYDVNEEEAIFILREASLSNILKELFVFYHKDRWLESYYSLDDIPAYFYDEETGKDFLIKIEELFVCFEVVDHG
ncbi:hypothetical protein [Enterococcus bulliens]